MSQRKGIPELGYFVLVPKYLCSGTKVFCSGTKVFCSGTKVFCSGTKVFCSWSPKYCVLIPKYFVLVPSKSTKLLLFVELKTSLPKVEMKGHFISSSAGT